MSIQYAQLVEKISRIVRDRGDVELMVLLDKIADQETEVDQATALGLVVKILNQGKKSPPHGAASSGSSNTAPSAARAAASPGQESSAQTTSGAAGQISSAHGSNSAKSDTKDENDTRDGSGD